MRRLRRELLISIVALTAVLVLGMWSAVSAESPQSNPTGGQATTSKAGVGEAAAETITVPVGAPALQVYRDPVTGEIGPPPTSEPSLQVPPAMEEAVSTSSEGLVETQDAGGGVMVDLQGRFRHFTTATKDEHGNISVSHSH
jgi:hypothetical protein